MGLPRCSGRTAEAPQSCADLGPQRGTTGVSSRRERATRVYICLTGVACVLVLWVAAVSPSKLEWSWWGVAPLLVGTILTELWAVPLPKAGAVSISSMLHIATALLLPPLFAAVVVGLGMLLSQLRERAPLSRVLFNTWSASTIVGLTAIVASQLGLLDGQLGQTGPGEIVAFFLLVTVNYVLNDLIV